MLDYSHCFLPCAPPRFFVSIYTSVRVTGSSARPQRSRFAWSISTNPPSLPEVVRKSYGDYCWRNLPFPLEGPSSFLVFLQSICHCNGSREGNSMLGSISIFMTGSIHSLQR